MLFVVSVSVCVCVSLSLVCLLLCSFFVLCSVLVLFVDFKRGGKGVRFQYMSSPLPPYCEGGFKSQFSVSMKLFQVSPLTSSSSGSSSDSKGAAAAAAAAASRSGFPSGAPPPGGRVMVKSQGSAGMASESGMKSGVSGSAGSSLELRNIWDSRGRAVLKGV